MRPFTLLIVSAAVLSLSACSARTPLDPRTAETGGALTERERATDVLSYDLTLELFPTRRSLRGSGTTLFRALAPISVLELQLDPRFSISQVRVDGAPTEFRRDAGSILIALQQELATGEEARVEVDYAGKPWVAERAPWDGGFVWSETPEGEPWIATAVQTEGCDLWWPCKDHFADKPESMALHVTVPQGLSVALNGVLESTEDLPDGRRTFHWAVNRPISDYNVSLNVGPFERLEASFESVNGTQVPIEFWALKSSADNARTLIDDDLQHQIAWFEQTLGPYPWGDEKLGLVETPHLGMEHQTLNAYGNKFKRDPHGFDWLLQHELAHEWFGNLMTHERSNDAWLHEGLGSYMQPAYSLDRFGRTAYHHRLYESYLNLNNCKPVVQEGDPTSNEAFTGDIYGKGMWVLHTLRQHIGDQAFWSAIRRLLYDTPTPWKLQYPIEPVYRSTEDFVRLVNEEAMSDLTWMFDVYLREADLPTLEISQTDERLELAWTTPGDRAFPMPVPVQVDGSLHTVVMADSKGSLRVSPDAHVIVDPNMDVLRQLPIIGTCKDTSEESP